MNNDSKKISSEIAELEREKELLVDEKSVLREKIRDKKREISALEKRLKKAEKPKEKERDFPVSLRTLLFLPIISVTFLLSLIYANGVFPFANLAFTSTYYPLIIPFIIFFITLVNLIATIFYFALYQLIQNCRKAK